MKNESIWHTADITPEPCRILICKTNKRQNYTAIIPSPQEWNTMILPEFYNLGDIDNAERIEQYAYLDDLLALETELDRTRKALDVAVDALGYYASENSWDETNRWMFVENGFEFARDVLVKIDKTLEQKE